jgi:hypothetical protein
VFPVQFDIKNRKEQIHLRALQLTTTPPDGSAARGPGLLVFLMVKPENKMVFLPTFLSHTFCGGSDF